VVLTFILAFLDNRNIIHGDVAWPWYLLSVVLDLVYLTSRSN